MRIVYVARHGSGGADDEGAVLHALRELGHEVALHSEDGASRFGVTGEHDLLLFHKWDNVGRISEFKGKKVFWYFDLVDFPGDPSIYLRCKQRRAWMERTIPAVNLGFCTDGDWVVNWNERTPFERKLTWLPQGADERVVGLGDPAKAKCGPCDILFTGMRRNCGEGRWSFVQEMERVWGNRFKWIERGIYGRELADQIAASKVVVAPDFPVTDRYWSNRIYTSLGFGACMVHPFCSWLNSQEHHYIGGVDYLHYHDRPKMHELIGRLLEDAPMRAHMSRCALERTRAAHLYRHRCEELMRVVQARLFA